MSLRIIYFAIFISIIAPAVVNAVFRHNAFLKSDVINESNTSKKYPEITVVRLEESFEYLDGLLIIIAVISSMCLFVYCLHWFTLTPTGIQAVMIISTYWNRISRFFYFRGLRGERDPPRQEQAIEVIEL
ncbi:PREDICTED: uncharacterized protein LOC105565334 [Vollenhovia emeryi]|uniref:uncharacterized protein LOC105565334 n=1 Tax=Vollenhovia emeryi TaxID=411798 RepID=UPI0005F58DE4|nr:PREDICTED: uncharacterized protein LOC105565334 [Vollenhovia emeryi]